MPSLVASKLITGGHGLAPALLRRAATASLDWDTRQKSRFEATDSTGRAIGVFLARGTIVRGGDVLVAEDGSLVVVQALAQPVLVATAAKASQTPALDLARAAYHLGNRHVSLEVRADRLVLEPDHVLAELLRRMGLDVAETSGAFEPEAGAYDAASAHGHAGTHDHDHDHGHDHSHGHGHDDSHDGAHELHDHGHHPRKP
jgi:urease accessory protein